MIYIGVALGIAMIVLSIYELVRMIKTNDPELNNFFDED